MRGLSRKNRERQKRLVSRLEKGRLHLAPLKRKNRMHPGASWGKQYRALKGRSFMIGGRCRAIESPLQGNERLNLQDGFGGGTKKNTGVLGSLLVEGEIREPHRTRELTSSSSSTACRHESERGVGSRTDQKPGGGVRPKITFNMGRGITD